MKSSSPALRTRLNPIPIQPTRWLATRGKTPIAAPFALLRMRMFRRPLVFLLLVFLALASVFAPYRVEAGSGRINADGTMDVTVNLRWPPSAADLTMMQNQLTAASQVLWDATEGQLRFGRVTLTSGSVDEDLADLWVFAGDFRSGLSFFTDGSSLGTRGDHISLSTADLLGFPIGTVIAHEFGHLAIGLGDEYDEQPRSIGPCLDGGMTEQNHCLMQQPPGFTQTEFCTAAMHDPLQGFVAGRFETTQQSGLHSGRSCWQQLVINLGGRIPAIAAPAGLPVALIPGGFVNPVFVDETTATDTVMLVLDRSDSMNWNTESDFGEVCGDGIDNDGDGMADETDCTQPRFAFLKAAGRAWVNLANNNGINAGIMSFNHGVSYDLSFRMINDGSVGDFRDTIRDLSAGGLTAIGDALRQSIGHFPVAGVNKTALLISDGFNTSGENPGDVVPDLRAAGIRVFTISTGGASSDSTLSEVAGATSGSRVDARSATTLINAFAQQWANYRNAPIIEPQRPYRTDQSISNSVIAFNLEANTPRLTLIAAGNMKAPADFGLRAILIGPGGESFDTDVAHPRLRVVRDEYFLLAELAVPAPGNWEIRLYAASGRPALQTGHVTLFSDNPHTDLFATLDRHVVDDTSIPVQLSVAPIHFTTLYNLASLTAEVKRPNGSVVTLPVPLDAASVGKGTYSTLIADMPFTGLYEVRVRMQTGLGTYNDPGEAIWSSSPPASVAVPTIQRIATQYFFVRTNTPNQGCIDIQCPTNLVRYACNTNRVPVFFSVSATNRCGTNLSVITTPPSGSFFSLGTTTVYSTAFGNGKTNYCSFTVTVLPDPNCQPPSTNCIGIQCPTNQVRYACNTNRIPVFFSVSATNRCNTNLTVITTPPSGSLFSLGTTTVNSTAYGNGQSNYCSFTVTVLPDPNCQPPSTNCLELTCSTNIVAYTCGTNCVPVYYNVSAKNNCKPNDISLSVYPLSGTCFPPGTHTVNAWAYGSGQTNYCSFTVTVLVNPNCGTNNCSTNLLTNGSFENPGVPDGYVAMGGGDPGIFGWVTALNGVEYFTPVWPSPLSARASSAAAGNYLLDLAPAGGIGGGVRQTFATVPSKSYRVSFAMGTSRQNGRNGTASLAVNVAGVAYAFNHATSSTNTVWAWKHFSFVATGGSTTLTFGTLDDPATSYVNLDDVRVTDCCDDPGLRITPGVILEWDCGILQAASEVSGPYLDVLGATSPHSEAATSGRRYWRIRN